MDFDGAFSHHQEDNSKKSKYYSKHYSHHEELPPRQQPIVPPQPTTLGVVTDKVFFDVTIDDKPAGRVVFGLFGDDLPRTVDNFMTIAEGTAGVGKLGEEMDYWQTTFHRVIPGFMA